MGSLQSACLDNNNALPEAVALLRALGSQLALGQHQYSQKFQTLRPYSSSSTGTPAPDSQQQDAGSTSANAVPDTNSGSPPPAPEPVLAQQQSVAAYGSSSRQPVTAYGARKVTLKSQQAGVQKREGIVHVNSTMNNTIMVLTDRDHKVQTWTSGGTVGNKNANKATPMAAEQAAMELAKRAVAMGFHSVVVKLKGMGKNKQFAVQSLAANGLTVTQLWDVTPIPYNGCRLPRRRRV